GRCRGSGGVCWCVGAGGGGPPPPPRPPRGIALPLAATAQKVWDERPPSRSWADFESLARRVS
ncbi:beta-N-acetylglucosaminidase, partial [Streptomyces sp. NPDC058953]